MADPWITVCKPKFGTSPSGELKYHNKHLRSLEECGCLLELVLRRDPGGALTAQLHNPWLWAHVGFELGTRHVDDKLLLNLCMGLDLAGNPLSEVAFFRPPVEIIVALPCELSVALAPDPTAAELTLHVAGEVLFREAERHAITARVGQRKTEVRPGKILALGYRHALNHAREDHLHFHGLVFPSALGEEGWRAYTNRQFLRMLHTLEGARRRVMEAVIAEAARHGYLVEIVPGKFSPDHPHGAKVTCPDGSVILPGSVPRGQGALVHARRALWLQFGSAPLTPNELPLVLAQEGQFPVAAAGGNRQEVFVQKLEHLHLLDADGRVKKDLVPALAEIDASMAIVQASLRDLPFLDPVLASAVVRARREELHSQVDGISTDEWQARLIWTNRYDALLELVGNEPYDWRQLPTAARNDLYLLEQAGVIRKHWDNGLPAYRLTAQGEARRSQGLQEVEAIRAAVPHLFAEVSVGDPSPEVRLGRLHSAGVRVRGTSLDFRKLGRAAEAQADIENAGITESTKALSDIGWWQHYWRRRRELPEVLAKVMLRPEEVPPDWFPGMKGAPKKPAIAPSENEGPRFQDDGWAYRESRQNKKQIIHPLLPNLPSSPEIPPKDIKHDRNR